MTTLDKFLAMLFQSKPLKKIEKIKDIKRRKEEKKTQ
jgi:hypothetical protein